MRIKKMIATLATLAGLSYAVEVNVSGKLDLSKAGTAKIITAQISGTNIVDTVDKNTGMYSLRSAGTPIVERQANVQPGLAWKELGKSVRMIGNSTGYVVDAYSFDGKIVTKGAKFVNGVAVVGNGSKMIYTRLRTNNTNIATRSMVDSTPVLGLVVFIIIDSDGKSDTLAENPITSWSSVIPTKFVVSRNVDVTVPVKYDRDTVKVGWWNTHTNPSQYFSIVLGRSYKSQYSGIIFTAFDSASYGSDEYLYSAVAIIKHGDSVVAFTKDLDTVTAKVGNFKFDSTRFANKIVSHPLADTAIIPWYSFTVNKSSVNVALNKVMTLDSVITYSDSLFDSTASKFRTVVQTRDSLLQIYTFFDTSYDYRTVQLEGSELTTVELDSVRIEYVPDYSTVDSSVGEHSTLKPKFLDSVQAGVLHVVTVKLDLENIWSQMGDKYGATYNYSTHCLLVKLIGVNKQETANNAKVFFIKKKRTLFYK